MKLQARDIVERSGGCGKASFTLLEVLVAVAALGLIAVGVASIFGATGRVVTKGRQVSAFNSYASLIEQQLRSDIASMTRDGYLIIRNQVADGNGDGTVLLTNTNTPNVDAVPLYNGDENPRTRRIDELMFFTKGQFSSARGQLHPSLSAHADAARIYYGHGTRALPPTGAYNPQTAYYTPQLNDRNDNMQGTTRLGYDSPNNDNPNRYASDWILLRHVTLLSPPHTAEVLASGPIFGLPANSPMLADSPIQIGLQPAAPSIFRALCNLFPVPVPNHLRTEVQSQHPLYSSGLVDVAATDLSITRSIVMSARVMPSAADQRFFNPNDNQQNNEQTDAGVDNIYTLYGTTGNQDPRVVDRIQQWMADGLPANSEGTTANMSRIRCEGAPVNYLYSLDRANWNSDADAACRQADQTMLAASNFLPHCTEFIVEWSFGKTYPSDSGAAGYNASRAGQLIWHGMHRQVDNQVVADPYFQGVNFNGMTVPFTRVDGSVGNYLVQTRLIHGEAVATAAPPWGAPLSSYFGYVDPTFNPDQDGDGLLRSASDSVSPTIPWAWPKLIRVTLSLADPNDPTIERTFQFVFEVPDRDGV
jgi:type II secretory pathway pseudopilin PulG